MSAVRSWSAPDSGTSVASHGVVQHQAISNEAVETSPFNGRVSLHSFLSGWATSCIPTWRETLRRRLR